MAYIPKPIDTTGVELPPELEALEEELARNTHDIWAALRMGEGWRPGRRTLPEQRLHRNLVAYEKLPEAEKEYDRRVASGTLRAILARGFTINQAATRESGRPLASPVGDVGADTGPVMKAWAAREPGRWSASLRGYQLLAKWLNDRGEHLYAYDVAEEGLQRLDASNIRLRQMRVLALLRSGAMTLAADGLAALMKEWRRHTASERAETSGLLARLAKGEWLERRGEPDDAVRLARTITTYRRAHRDGGGFWVTINAATLAHVAGRNRSAAHYARVARREARALLRRRPKEASELYWAHATVAEAELILGNLDAARASYHEAIQTTPGDFGNIGSTRRNAEALLGTNPAAREFLAGCFPAPSVVVFSGHMIDLPGRAAPRFPPWLARRVKQALRRHLRPLQPLIGYSSAACGADLLFLEVVLALGGSVRIVLPYNEDEFEHDSVDVRKEGAWKRRYHAVLRHRSARVSTVSTHRVGTMAVSYDYANQVLLGLARDQARQLDAPLLPLAVWDGRPGHGPGGTASAVAQWVAHDLPFDWLDLDHERRGPLRIVRREPAAFRGFLSGHTTADSRSPDTAVRSMLFADVSGFSRLTDDETRYFIGYFPDLVATIVARWSEHVLMRNTWGDGLFVVFDTIEAAGLFALELRDRVKAVDWAALGLPDTLGIRIALHAGPVHEFTDSVTNMRNFAGAHVSQAARVEPITPPGEVYCSQGFAALVEIEEIRSLRCHFVGQRPLAKGYGIFPTYHLERKRGV